MIGIIGIESCYKHCTQFYIKHYAKIVIMQFIPSLLIVTYRSLFQIVKAINQIHVV